jgi:CHAD domain-containing protein
MNTEVLKLKVDKSMINKRNAETRLLKARAKQIEQNTAELKIQLKSLMEDFSEMFKEKVELQQKLKAAQSEIKELTNRDIEQKVLNNVAAKDKKSIGGRILSFLYLVLIAIGVGFIFLIVSMLCMLYGH